MSNIQETSFGPKRYLTLVKKISTDQISDKEMYDTAGKKLGAYLAKHSITPVGPWSVLYFMWDMKIKKGEIGISFPVEGVEVVDDPELSIIDVPKSNASMDVLKGDYSGLATTHQALMKYVTEKDFESVNLPVMAVEEYIVSPMKDHDPANWVTNIYYLHN